ncbi:MAG: heavy-metal-associated domain-containing protein [Candidatus Zixiibacteriota bacterium]
MTTQEIKLNITGMTCGGCAAMIQKALFTVPEVADVEVSHEKGTAVITVFAASPDTARLIETVRQAGYDATLPTE